MKKTLIYIEGKSDIKVSFKGPTDARIQFMKVLLDKYTYLIKDKNIKVISILNEGEDKGEILEIIENA
jgi:hypothetical protein